jgi:hypothetical protein
MHQSTVSHPAHIVADHMHQDNVCADPNTAIRQRTLAHLATAIVDIMDQKQQVVQLHDGVTIGFRPQLCRFQESPGIP